MTLNSLRRPLIQLCTVSIFALGGCDPQATKLLNETESGEDNSGTGDTDAEETTGDWGDELPIPPSRALDVLLVVDNSWSMGTTQRTLSASLTPLLASLTTTPSGPLDLRFAVTTTDAGHQSCNSLPGNGGHLSVSSCRDRPDSFTDPSNSISRFNTACDSQCNIEPGRLELLPTTTALDSTPAVRPWIELSADHSNLAPGIGAGDALGCIAAVGIDGCGYEAPLEAMALALSRSGMEDSPSRGFVRDDASLLIIFVTDEADCSYNGNNPEAREAFEPENKVFWPEAHAGGPTSAICWNAGVACQDGGDDGAKSCWAQQYNAQGQAIDNSNVNQGVLHSIVRYTQLIEQLQSEKSQYGADVVVTAINGVTPSGDVYYPSSGDRDHVAQFGIGPGCEVQSPVLEEADPSSGASVAAHEETRLGIPPARMRAFMQAVNGADQGDAHMHSICANDFGAAMTAIAAQTLTAIGHPQ